MSEQVTSGSESWASVEGLPFPLGVSWSADDQAYNFALYSKHATAVRLLLFCDDFERPHVELALDPLIHKSGRVWHCRIAETAAAGCRYYGYVVDGPEPAGPFELHEFHPEKILLDPYARCIAFPPGFDRTAAIGRGGNLGKAALGVIDACAPAFDWGGERLSHHESDSLIYELHVRGFTQHQSSGVSEVARGTFAGVAEEIPYLRELGVTIVELMPVFQNDPQGCDSWGYMPMSFFAPHGRYQREQPLRPQDDPRQHALLGPRDARRRFSLRSRVRVHAQPRRHDQLRGSADLRRHPIGPRL